MHPGRKRWIVILIVLDLIFTAFATVEFVREESRIYTLTKTGANVIERQAVEIQANADGTEWEGPPARVSVEEAHEISRKLHTNHESLSKIVVFGALLAEKFVVIAILAWAAARGQRILRKSTEARKAEVSP